MTANESVYGKLFIEIVWGMSLKVIALFEPELYFFFLANKGFSGPLVDFHKRLSVTSNQLKAFCANLL